MDMTDFVETNTNMHQNSSPPIWIMLISFGLLVVFLASIGWGLQQTQRSSNLVGQQAPDFSLVTMDGQTINKASLSGKIVVMNFWASWCQPCKDEAALLEESWQSVKSDGDVVFFGVVYADIQNNAQKFLQTNAITYPNGMDNGSELAKAYRVRGVPETFILDREGRIAVIQIGPFQSSAELVSILDTLD
jgi:cytochrome c biogenesis protein CcmG/thiol:disulfide interchange protein DsbE